MLVVVAVVVVIEHWQAGRQVSSHTHTHTHANKPSLFTLERFNGYVSHLIQFIWHRCQGTVGQFGVTYTCIYNKNTHTHTRTGTLAHTHNNIHT